VAARVEGPAEVLVRESAEPAAPADLAARLRDYLAFLGTPRDELAGLGLGELVERAAAGSS
jgi:hypothetical protein